MSMVDSSVQVYVIESVWGYGSWLRVCISENIWVPELSSSLSDFVIAGKSPNLGEGQLSGWSWLTLLQNPSL